MLLASTLSFLEGLLQSATVVLLVLTAPDIHEIVLNFCAVGFVSLLDEHAFTLASRGMLGDVLEETARNIENMRRTEYLDKKWAYLLRCLAIGLICLAIMGCAWYGTGFLTPQLDSSHVLGTEIHVTSAMSM